MLFDVCQRTVFDPAVRWTAISLPPTQLSTSVERGALCSIESGWMSHAVHWRWQDVPLNPAGIPLAQPWSRLLRDER